MKKTLLSFFIIVIIAASPAIAANSSSSSAQNIKANTREARFNAARHLFSVMVKRLNAAVSRLELLGKRIGSRLTKLESEGVEVSALQEDLVQAQNALGQTKEEIAGLDSQLEQILAQDNPKIAFETVRTSVTSIKTDLKTVLETYVAIIRQMKGLRSTQSLPNASSSAVTQ